MIQNITILKDIIKDFDPEKFTHFFRDKNRSFAPRAEDLFQYDDDNFRNGKKLGEIQFAQGEKMLICAFEAGQPLSERSGKKAQYEKGKKLLKDTQADAGIFIFYDTHYNFRFSLIYAEYLGVKRRFSYFKRLTFFVSPRLTNKTFLQQIGECDFSNLENIKEAFSVEPVTKQFYGELQYWYFWAMDKIEFPDDYKYSNDPAKDKEIRNATNLIRLITRIIFIRFLTEKGLIPQELFSGEKLGRIVKDFMKGKKTANFYNAILQNLFFGTLNQKMNERKFAQEGDFLTNRKEYGVKNLYRYSDKFLISKNEVLELFKDIPFLNGGLFDCLDKDDESSKVIYVDGFSRNPAKQSIIPDYLFFQQEEERVDLSNYGLGASRPVRGLIEILNSYNFTIDENTPIDQEIALDPELLGKVFENLLASYNPETATTARKATGSYYTPREIVDYMVQESLVVYLANAINNAPQPPLKLRGGEGGVILPSPLVGEGKGEGDNDSRLRQLLSYSEEIPEFSAPERKKIISAIDNIKILDPACGSGAFPMGILHKLVYSLQKLDPQNKYWHELQYQKALKESEEVFKQDDKNERQERLKEINEAFDEGINYPDYARKLYLIENCIYGVDIQPIAIQISKLRFFISLVLDQKVDKSKENLGIRALPNLETKFVAANTLIGLDRPAQLTFKNPDIEKKEKELKQIRHKYFNAKTRTEKTRYQKEDKKLREKLSNEIKRILIKTNDDDVRNLEHDLKQAGQELNNIINQPEEIEIIENTNLFGEKEQIRINKKLKRIKNQKKVIKYIEELLNLKKNPPENTIDKVAKKIATFDLYDQNASADFFDSEWMFGVASNSPLTKGDTGGCGGFDIVIANPPYGQLQKDSGKLANLYKNCGYQTFERTGDIYTLFYENGINILKAGGHLCFITSNKWMRAGYGKSLRKFFNAYNPRLLVDLGPGIFESATVDTNILIIEKKKNQGQLAGLTLNAGAKDADLSDFISNNKNILPKMGDDAWFIGNQAEQNLKEKIERIGKPLKEWDVNIYRGVLTGLNEAFIVDTATRDRLVAEDPKSAEILKPILRGRDIKRYGYEWAGLWLIASGFDIDVPKKYPAVFRHLKQFEEKAKKRDDQGQNWWNLRACAYYPEFEKEKVVWKRIGSVLRFGFDTNSMYCQDSTCIMTGKKLKYLCAFMNSKLGYQMLYDKAPKTGTGDVIVSVQALEPLLIPPITPFNKGIVEEIECIVEKILSAKKQNPAADTSPPEREIDQLVYQLYGLTDDEIKIIENANDKQ